MRFIFIVTVFILASSSTLAASRCNFSCPTGMAPVCSGKIRVCVDRQEFKCKRKKKPEGYMNRFECEDVCKMQGKRILQNEEWLLACEGTPAQACNIRRAHPIITLYRSNKPWIRNGVDCKWGDNRWTPNCMNDPRINQLPKSLSSSGSFKNCVSRFGIYDMVGNLGEWVSPPSRLEYGRFNGGLYPQPESSCEYKTIAHGPSYADYSIGCRCGGDPARLKRKKLKVVDC